MTPPRLAVLTHRGLQRQENQDAVLANSPGDDRGAVLVVADGLGGLANGALASRHATQRVRAAIRACEHDELFDCVVKALESSNGELVEAAEGAPEKALGTTVVGLYLSGDHCTAFHMGDSRAYLLRDGELSALTEDHNVAAARLREGFITAEEAAIDPGRHQVTRCLGVDAEFNLEVGEPITLRSGDRLLICSDGLHGPVDDARIARLLARAETPLAAAASLVRAALSEGAPDNVSAGIAFIS